MSPMIPLAERAGREPFFLGYQLAVLRRESRHTFDEQAVAFGLEQETLAKLALCRMPADASDMEWTNGKVTPAVVEIPVQPVLKK